MVTAAPLGIGGVAVVVPVTTKTDGVEIAPAKGPALLIVVGIALDGLLLAFV